MKKLSFLIVFLLVAVNAFAYSYCTEPGSGWLICEDWDSGTPPADPWPTLDGVTWQGWTPDDVGDCPGDGDITTAYAHSGTKSLMQYKPSGCEDSTNLDHTFTASGIVYVRFYLYFTSEIANVNPASTHMIFIEETGRADSTLDIRDCQINSTAHPYYDCDSGRYLAIHTYGGGETMYARNTAAPKFNLLSHENEWILVEFKMDFTNNLGSLWINQTLMVDNAEMAWGDGPTAGQIRMSGYVINGGGGAIHWYYDDVVVSPTYIGPRAAAECTIDSDCNDSNVCTTDTCVSTVCQHANNTAACDDGLYCTINDTCAGGTCSDTDARDCADADNCTTDSCNETTNACENTYGATTVHLNTGDLEMAEAGGTGTAILHCVETAGTTDCCHSLDVDYTLGGTASGGGIDYTLDNPSPFTITDTGTITFTPANDADYEGGSGTYETIIPSLVAGTNYTLGTPSQETINIEDNDSPPATPPTDATLAGIYMLGQFDSLTTQTNSNQTWCDGYAARVTWGSLDAGTDSNTPAYTWTYIDNLFANAATYGNKVTIYLSTSVTPAHVLIGADTYTPLIAGTQYTTPVPWDAVALIDLDRFADDLAAHIAGLANPEDLAGLRITPMGLKGLDDESNRMVEDGAYVRATFLTAINTTIKSFTDAFPGIPIYIEIQAFYETGGYRLDTATIDSIETAFDGTPDPVIGFFAEDWSSDSPITAGQQGINLNHARSHSSPVLFQSTSTWTAGSMEEQGGAFLFGRREYLASYYEVYRMDVIDAALGPMFEKWQNVMNGTAVPGGCKILSTGTGSQTISPSGTGSESIFYPTLQ